jgi:cell wall-associated NlpC family hydrolase
MIKILEQYINPGYVYRFTHGPNVVDSRESALRQGINCVSLAHLALKDLFAVQLPSNLLCSELYNDRIYFRTIDRPTNLQVGDLVWFGVANPKITVDEFVPKYNDGELLNWPDFPVKHVAIYTGDQTESGEPLLLHSSASEGTNTVWALGRFTTHARYKELYGITRLKMPGQTEAQT